jgi:hypothetical protein
MNIEDFAMADEGSAQSLRHPAVDGLHLIDGERVKVE